MVETKLQISYDEIRMLTNHVQSVREEERIHIAREIHDELGQQLTVLRMDILALKDKSEELPVLLKTKTDRMIQMVENSMRTVKKIVSELRPGILDDLGLAAALEWQAKEFQKSLRHVSKLPRHVSKSPRYIPKSTLKYMKWSLSHFQFTIFNT